MSEVTIRPATVEDFEALVELGEAMRLESRVYFPQIDRVHLRKNFEIAVLNPDNFAVLVAETDRIIGFLVGYCFQYFSSAETAATNDLFYLVPGSRQFAPRMVAAFEAWAEARGAREVNISVRTGGNLDWLERIGFRNVGGNYQKPL